MGEVYRESPFIDRWREPSGTTGNNIDTTLNEVRAWLEHPEAGGYRMLKLRLLLDKGYVDLQETMLLWEDRHKG
jgi:hypothetical protein